MQTISPPVVDTEEAIAKTLIYGVIVTFRPTQELNANVGKLAKHVASILIVDNCSPEGDMDQLVSLSELDNVHLIRLDENKGIAAALNVGVRWGLEQGFAFVALFDQDSAVTPDFLQIVSDCYVAAPDRQRLAIVSARYAGPAEAADKDISSVITSGSVIPLKVFEECGLFEEDLFIDGVDDEFCLRTSSLGYRFRLTGKKGLIHSLGAPTPFSFLGWHSTTANYGAKRRYYRNRNRMQLVGRFWRTRPGWCKVTLKIVVLEILKIIIAEADRMAKLRYTMLGLRDGITGKMGKVVEL